jgi:hypothetical protein
MVLHLVSGHVNAKDPSKGHKLLGALLKAGAIRGLVAFGCLTDMKTESIDHSNDSVNRMLFKMTEGLVDHGYIGTVLRKRVLCKSR